MNVLLHTKTALDRTRNEASELKNEAIELRATTGAVIELQCYSPPRVSDPEELLSQNGKPTNDSQENQTNLVNKNEALATSNMDLRNKIEVSASESNSSNYEK